VDSKVNIFNRAKNAGTSVDQIERFYARHLPLVGTCSQLARLRHQGAERLVSGAVPGARAAHLRRFLVDSTLNASTPRGCLPEGLGTHGL
jgi:hypothetical protein